MPFVTEELWQRLTQGSRRSISLAPYPKAVTGPLDGKLLQRFQFIQAVVTAARELRGDHRLDPKAELAADLQTADWFAPDDLAIVAALAKLDFSGKVETGLTRSGVGFDLLIQAPAAAAENPARIAKEVAQLKVNIQKSKGQLSDAKFLSRAPEHVVASIRIKLSEYETQLSKLQGSS